MGESHNFRILKEAIIGMSEADTWFPAKQEWHLAKRWDAGQQWEVCTCTHHPIRDICWIRNDLTGCDTIVGNCCIKHFEEEKLDSDLFFQGLKRIRKNPKAAMNAAVIEDARKNGWLNDWEHGFLLDTKGKRKLSGAQAAKRLQINEKVLGHIDGIRPRPKQQPAIKPTQTQIIVPRRNRIAEVCAAPIVRPGMTFNQYLADLK